TISGTGTVSQIGAGILTLGGTNTYQGGTTATAGLIDFSSLANFGSGNITLNGGGLQWASGNTTDVSARLNPIGGGGGAMDTNGNNVLLASAITGTGGIVKLGTGTLVLAASENYGTGTIIQAGTLQLGNGGTVGSIVTNVTDNAILAF